MTKEELQNYRKNLREIELLNEQLKRLWAQMEGVRSSQLSDMPKAPHIHDKLGELYAQYDPIHTKYTQQLTELYSKQRAIEEEIEQKLDGVERDVIKYYYILDMPCIDVADKVGYEERQVYRYLKSAIEKLNMSVNVSKIYDNI